MRAIRERERARRRLRAAAVATVVLAGTAPLGPPAAAAASARTALPDGSETIPARPELLRFEPLTFEPPVRESRRRTLARGAVAYLEPDPTLPLVEITVATRIGSFLDPPGREGLARLTGAMLRRGGTEALRPEELDRRIDHLGATLEVRFGRLRGGATLDATRWTLKGAVDLLFDVLARPRFDAERLADARAELVEVMRQRNDDPLDILEREWAWRLFGTEHVSTRPPTPDSVGGIGRADLQAFHRRYLRPEGLVFAVSGDFDPDAMALELDRRLAAWPDPPSGASSGATPVEAASLSATKSLDWPPPPDDRDEPGLWLAPAEAPQAKVLLGHPAGQETEWTVEERAVLDLVSELLGGRGAVSRIVGRLRTAEGLVYRAQAGFDSEPPWPEGLRVFFETAPSGVARAVVLAREEIERLRREPVHAKELEVVRETLIGRLRARFDTARGVAGYLALDELLGRPAGFRRRRFEAFRAATPETVRRAAERHLRPDRLTVLVVGPPSAWQAEAPRKRLEAAAGGPLRTLPRRDPLTLRPLEPAEPREPAAGPPGPSRLDRDGAGQ